MENIRSFNTIEIPEKFSQINDHNASYFPLVPVTSKSEDTKDLRTKRQRLFHEAAAFGNLLQLKNLIENSASDSEVVQLIKSVDPTRKHRNALHLVSGFKGDPEKAEQCVKLLIYYLSPRNKPKRCSDEEYNEIIDAIDDEKDTPLYLAAKYENAKACRILMSKGSDLDKPNFRGKTPITKIFKKIPGIILEIVEESGKKSRYCYPDCERIKLHFRTIISVPLEEDIKNQNYTGRYREMDFLSNLSYTPFLWRTKILSDTHIRILIWLKWQHYRFAFLFARIFQMFWFFLYFIFLLRLYRAECPFPGEKVYNFSWFITNPSSEYFNNTEDLSIPFSQRNCATTSLRVMGWILLITAILDLLFLEGFPIFIRYRRKWYPMKKITVWKYFKKLLLILSVLHLDKLITVLTIFINTAPINFRIDLLSNEWQYSFAAIGIFMSWFQIFLQIGKFARFKGYIKMLTNTIYTLCLVGILYVSLIFAFAMVFCILLPSKVTFSSPFEAILRMSTFTIGEVDFEETFYGEDASIPASFILTATVFGAAIIALHIALLNFLIGVTINELQNVWKGVETWRTYTYLWQIYLFEVFISNVLFPVCQKFLKNRMVLKRDERLDVKRWEMKHETYYETDMDKLPKRFRKELRQLNLKVDLENCLVETPV